LHLQFVSDRICSKLFCSICIAKSKFPIPDYLLNIEFQANVLRPNEVQKDVVSQKQLLCSCGEKNDCMTIAIAECMEILKSGTQNSCGVYIDMFLINECPLVTFDVPSSEIQDSYTTKAMRYSHVASIVADIRYSIC